MKILLLGTHGQCNWGDDILLETFLTQLGSGHTYYVNSYDPRATENAFAGRFNITCFHTTRNRLSLLRYLLACDAVFFAGGTILRELYASSGRNRYASLFMVVLLCLVARYIARKRIIMSNIGVGPLPSRFGKRLAGIALNTTILASFRDQTSMQLATECGARGEMLVVPDCVFVNEPSVFAERSQGENLGINVLYDVSEPSVRDKNRIALVEALRNIRTVHMNIVPIPMQIGFNPHDDVTEISHLLRELHVEVSAPQTVRELGGRIASCNFIIAARYHAVVIAAILGIPVVPLLYDLKVRSLAERLGILDIAIDISKEVKPAMIIEAYERAVEKRELAQTLRMRASAFREELLHYFERVRREIA